MKINESISPAIFKNSALVIGFFIVFSVWQAGNNKITDLQYQSVYGESLAVARPVEKVDLKSLPIVVSQSDAKGISGLDVNDLMIEAAFKAPEFVEVQVEVQEPKVTLVEKVYLTYRPTVSAISQKGAVINGVFWTVGEAVKTMPTVSGKGQPVIPVLTSVSRNQIVLQIADEIMTLPFERF